MSGRIKLLRDGAPVSDADDPPIPYEYQTPSEFDAKCGTYGLDAYQLPNTQCPSKFVCGADDSQIEAIVQSAKCYDAFNCAMMAGMTTGAASGSEIALFLHQYVRISEGEARPTYILTHSSSTLLSLLFQRLA